MAKFHSFLFLFLLLQGAIQDVKSQAFEFTSITVSEGLPHGQVRAIHQTDDGYMWIGTAASGMVRYDGHNFDLYNQSHGLKDDSVHRIFQQSDGRLWVATYNGGVSVMDGDKFMNPFETHPIDSVYVTSIHEFTEGELWFTTLGNGVYIYDGTELQQLTTTEGLAGNNVWAALRDHDGQTWLGTTEGLSMYDGAHFTTYTDDDGLSGNSIFGILELDGIIWLGTDRGITQITDHQVSTVTEIEGRSLHYVYDLIADSSGRIWIGMENDGIYRYENGDFTHITRIGGLGSNQIYTLFSDADQNIWIGTDERGISIYRNDRFRFYKTGHGLLSGEILSLHKDPAGTIWIATDLGLQYFNGRNFVTIEVPPAATGDPYIWDLETLSNGDLILVTDDNVILGFNGNEFYNFSEQIGHTDEWIYDLKVASNNDVWIATDAGMLRYDGHELHSYTTDDGLTDTVHYHSYESSTNEIWVSANGGFARFDGERFQSFGVDDGLAHYNVNYITEDSKGDLWIGTSAGVTHYKPSPSGETGTMTNFGREDGMKLVETLSLWFDKNDQLWQATNGGLHQLDVATYRESGEMNITHHPLADHGIGLETMHKAIITDSTGRGWFGTMDGILIVDDNISARPASPPPPFLTSVQLNGEDISWPEMADSVHNINGRRILPPIHIPYKNQNLSFNFVGLNYLRSDQVEYRYTLEGFDAGWETTSSSTSAMYANLAPGNYNFKVQARHGSGPWSDSAAIYQFSVDHPFWHTYWFWALIILGLTGSLYGFLKIKMNNLEREKLALLVDEKTHHLQEALDEKVILLKEVHHRVKNNLAVIYSLLDLQSGYLEDEKTRVIFDDSKLRVRSIALVHEKLYQNNNLSKIEADKYIPDLIEVIRDSLYTDQKKIELTMDIDDVYLSIDQGIPCGLILNELISNVYKHAFSETGEGMLNVLFKETNGLITLEVKDDGKGLPDDFSIENSTSLGLILIKTLSAQIKADFKIDTSGSGSTFTIKFQKETVSELTENPVYN